MRSRRTTWMVGGAGLVACGVAGVLARTALGAPGAPGPGPVRMIGDVVYAAAVLLLAVGTSREASVVARRPLGITALVVVALWPLAASPLLQLIGGGGADSGWGGVAYGYIALVLPAGVGLIAAVQIARAGIVPSPWRWAPLWVLGVHVAAFVIPQIVYAAGRSGGIQGWADVFVALGMLAFLAGTLGLGILALMLAARQRPESVEVYRST